MTIETKELVVSDELKRKIEMICRFAYVDYLLENGNIKSIKDTNIAYVKPHILKVNNNDFEDNDIFEIAKDTDKEEELFEYADIDYNYSKDDMEL